MKTTATLTSKGQVTIPKAVRELLGLHTGDALEFEVEQGKLAVRPARRALSSAGILKAHLPKGWKAPTVEEMDAGMGEYFRKKYRRA